MGRSYWFECEKCGYRTKVSGRADRGLNVFIQTVACRDCRELYDAVVQVRIPEKRLDGAFLPGFGLRRPGAADHHRPPQFPLVLNRLLYHGTRRFQWLRFRLQCPRSALHRVRAWNDPDHCPKCGVFMERNAEPYRIWD